MSALLNRRGELLARIATQRDQVAELGARLETPLVFAEKGLAAVRFLRSAPVVSAVLVALLVNRRRILAAVVKGAWRLWKGYRRLSALEEIAEATLKA
ncbi:MAG: YqjK family protein [Gallionella sp.]